MSKFSLETLWFRPGRSTLRRIELVLLCGVALLMAGCAATSVRTCCAYTAQQALTAADAALASYEALRTVAGDTLYNQGYMRVVMSAEPDAVDFTNVADADMGQLLDLRTRACRQLKTAAEQLRQACSAPGKAEATQSYAAIVEALRGFAKDAAQNSEFKKMAAALPTDATAFWQARDMEQARCTLAHASHELAALWARERATWEEYIDMAYISGYATGLLSLRLESFDEKELAKKINEPYSVSVKAGLFKMTKYFEALQAAAKVKTRLRATTEALEALSLSTCHH